MAIEFSSSAPGMILNTWQPKLYAANGVEIVPSAGVLELQEYTISYGIGYGTVFIEAGPFQLPAAGVITLFMNAPVRPHSKVFGVFGSDMTMLIGSVPTERRTVKATIFDNLGLSYDPDFNFLIPGSTIISFTIVNQAPLGAIAFPSAVNLTISGQISFPTR